MNDITKSKRWIDEEKKIKRIVDARRIIGDDELPDDDLILAMIENGYVWNDDAGEFGEWE